jgi:hypothetical protein
VSIEALENQSLDIVLDYHPFTEAPSVVVNFGDYTIGNRIKRRPLTRVEVKALVV